MHIGKMMARLGPKPASYAIGSGGIPDTTPQDVAAALGMVPDGLGSELLCRLWWPDGATMTARPLADLLESVQRAEWMRREKAMQDALCLVASHTGGDTLRKAQRAYNDAHMARWPRWVDDADLGTINAGYRRVRSGVIAEIVDPNQCRSCGGTGHIQRDNLRVICDRCRGTGRGIVSDRSRADGMRINESSFRRTWAPVYQWTLDHCMDALSVADRIMRD